MGFKAPITISEVINGIEHNNYLLPAIQREFVWDAEQIEKLFDSLMKGYPIGSFLFWKINPENHRNFQLYKFMDFYHERDHKHNQPINLTNKHSDIIAVLDGQQRLTALNIGLRGFYADKLPYYHWDSDHAFPKRKLYLNLYDNHNDSSYEFKMLKDKDVKNSGDDKYWFEVKEIIKFDKLQSVMGYCIKNGLTENQNTYSSECLSRLYEIIKKDKSIHYFMEEEQELDKVLNIFIRVNSGGTQLSYSDMLLSIASAQWKKKDAREEIYELVDELNDIGDGFNFDKDFILKSCLVLADIKQIKFKVDNFNSENMQIIEDKWDEISDILKKSVKLIASWGYNRKNLTSNNSIIPLAYYISKNELTEESKKKMLGWYRIALLKRIFSGQSDRLLKNLRNVFKDNNNGFPVKEINKELRKLGKPMRFEEEELEDLLSYSYGKKYTFSVLSLLYPWINYTHHFHIDHIYPRSMFYKKNLKKKNIPPEEWDEWKEKCDKLPNLQLLKGQQNLNKSDEAFEEWLENNCESQIEFDEYKRNHLIPNQDLEFQNFKEFYNKRENIIRNRLKQILTITE